ncbi:MAG: Peptidyl-prolyl cis-trans isomerase fpr2 [Thelocarpon superellum]|nr:MAG: Peptidyl-prolyl cis-trans isomerase fpr2 [Thelocarpon superellum]
MRIQALAFLLLTTLSSFFFAVGVTSSTINPSTRLVPPFSLSFSIPLSAALLLSLNPTPAMGQVQVEELKAAPAGTKRKTQRGDTIKVHYRGTLASDGSEFDASYNRGQPLSFTVGKGQVIKGWDDNLLDMGVGEKRKLTIPPEFAYGDRAMGPIPAGSTLIFETELVEIVGVKNDEL